MEDWRRNLIEDDEERLLGLLRSAHRVAVLGIKTEVVRKATKGSNQATLVPAAALVYEADGSVWVYTIGDTTNAAETVTFLRVAVTVTRIDGDSAELQSGPPAGAPVVTVGGAELLGTEYNISGEE